MTDLLSYDCPVLLDSEGKLVLEGRRDDALYHDGGPFRIIRYQERDAPLAYERGGEAGLRLLHELAFHRCSDARTLYVAIKKLRRDRKKAPGLDLVWLEELSESACWSLARACAAALRSGRYECSNDRIVPIAKPGKPGQTRPIHIRVAADRVVGKAFALIAAPGCELIFSPRSFGYRRGKSREDALAAALAIARAENRWYWVCVDIEKAFERIPRPRLVQALKRLFPDDVIDIVIKLIGGETGRGIPMGGCESPLLANLYLDFFLDRPWLRDHPDWPLLRYVDDLLVLCRSTEEAEEVLRRLQTLCRSIGMPLKAVGTPCLNLQGGGVVEYVGFAVQINNGNPTITIPQRAFDKLANDMVLAHRFPLPAVRVIQMVRGWFAQQGPAWESEDVNSVLTRVRQLACDAGFDELPGDNELLRRWSEGHDRWQTRFDAMNDETFNAGQTLGSNQTPDTTSNRGHQ